ncbi:NAD(P)/FAD-dependent oxidoreductase [Litoribrevibacter euphylliae]|uniref:NAD(P)/FAD-dependent oxidoreductase n=1 Tax=Litoribrevibacter euphylliae TaxID=1834034 RepID=A0ABV7H8M4_9GAMM
MNSQVIIVGAGAAGLMCAISAAQNGKQVMVLDHANKAGKKILMSGGGRCNFTNMFTEPDNYLSENEHFCKSALSRYTQWDFMAMVDKHGIPYHEKTLGQLFCDNKSSDILNMLLTECEQAGVEIRLDHAIEAVEKVEDHFELIVNGQPATCESLVIATGGLSIPTLGATGFGYDLARQFGLKVLDTSAGLVPFTITDQLKNWCTELSGTAIDCVVSCNGQSFKEAFLFTHRGLSGPAMLQISSYWKPGDSITINLLPNESALDWLQQAQADRPNTELKTLLADQFTKKVAALMCQDWFESRALKTYNEPQLKDIARQLEAWVVTPSGTEGYRTAEVTLGGVDTDEVSSKTFEAKKVPGLYFIGEVLDVTGHLGGFNFQWAWASGYCCGQAL